MLRYAQEYWPSAQAKVAAAHVQTLKQIQPEKKVKSDLCSNIEQLNLRVGSLEKERKDAAPGNDYPRQRHHKFRASCLILTRAGLSLLSKKWGNMLVPLLSTYYESILMPLLIYNPSALSGTTWNLVVGNSYCVEQNFGAPPVITTTSASKAATPKGNGISTPIQTGMVANCNKFYLVKSGDQWGTIASSKGIALAQFYAWNTGVGNTCASLWLDTYVCVNVIGGTTTTSKKPTTTTAGNGVATPTPIQTDMITSCKKFNKVVLVISVELLQPRLVSRWRISINGIRVWEVLAPVCGWIIMYASASEEFT